MVFEGLAAAAVTFSPSMDLNYRLELRRQGKHLGIVVAETATGEKVGTLPCAKPRSYATGKRYKCGKNRPYVELLQTNGENEGAAVLQMEDHDEKARKFFRCQFAGRSIEGKCAEVPGRPAVVKEEDLVSPILPSIPELKTPNAHAVGASGWIYRSMAPKTDAALDAYRAFGIQEVLVFKNDAGRSVAVERENLEKRGIESHHVAFPWKDHTSFTRPCEQTVEALQIIHKAAKANRKILFHCTVGEDRTGFLAALYRLLSEKADPKTLFFEEMCERGYDLGDAFKPYIEATLKIREATTSLYLKLAEKIVSGNLTPERISPQICRSDDGHPKFKFSQFKCRTSTRFRP